MTGHAPKKKCITLLELTMMGRYTALPCDDTQLLLMLVQTIIPADLPCVDLTQISLQTS